MRSKFLKGEAKQMALAREAQPEYRELVRSQEPFVPSYGANPRTGILPGAGQPRHPIRRPRADVGRARGAYRPRSNAGAGGAGGGGAGGGGEPSSSSSGDETPVSRHPTTAPPPPLGVVEISGGVSSDHFSPLTDELFCSDTQCNKMLNIFFGGT